MVKFSISKPILAALVSAALCTQFWNPFEFIPLLPGVIVGLVMYLFYFHPKRLCWRSALHLLVSMVIVGMGWYLSFFGYGYSARLLENLLDKPWELTPFGIFTLGFTGLAAGFIGGISIGLNHFTFYGYFRWTELAKFGLLGGLAGMASMYISEGATNIAPHTSSSLLRFSLFFPWQLIVFLWLNQLHLERQNTENNIAKVPRTKRS